MSDTASASSERMLFLADTVQTVMTCLNGLMTCKYLLPLKTEAQRQKLLLLKLFSRSIPSLTNEANK